MYFFMELDELQQINIIESTKMCTLSINDYMKRIPTEMGNEILSYLIPEISDIIFCREYPKSNYNSYSSKYEVAYIGNHKIQNDQDEYLSRIWKKNGKHRYYITKEIVDTIETEYNDRCVNIYYYEYFSNYVGKNIMYAIIRLLFFVNKKSCK